MDTKDESHKQFEMYKKELKGEKEKVANLSVWKSQLSDKNKELKEENERYLHVYYIHIVPFYIICYFLDYLTKSRTFRD